MILQTLFNSLENNSEFNAFCIRDEFYTYGQLNNYIKKAVHAILTQCPDENVIAIEMSNDIETYAALLAILRLGKCLVTLNPRFPNARTASIIEQASISFVFSKKQEINHKYIRRLSLLEIDPLQVFPSMKCSAKDEAYILFTSGSTGQPKGVKISYENLNSFLISMEDLNVDYSECHRYLQMFDLTFDVSIAMILLPLLHGGCIYTVDANEIKFLAAYQVMEKYLLDFICIVPSMISYLEPYKDEINLPAVKYCIFTAEASSEKTIELWKGCVPNAEIINLYGPTEATIWCLGYFWKKDIKNEDYFGLIPIGKPLSKVSCIIQSKDGEIVNKPNTKGELCLGGDQITSGYLKNPEKNRSSFIIKNDVRYYKTGDLCFYNNDGNIMYCDRIDNQVQVQGFRVELNEIELRAKESLNYSKIVAVPIKNKLGNTEILLVTDYPYLDKESLMLTLKEKLPFYMLPSRIESLNEIPINQNGKTDRNLLKSMFGFQ